MASASATPPQPSILLAIFWGGLVCGVLDITAAFVQWAIRGVSPVRILQSIASGLLGPAAFQGGASTAALGAGLHFLIAFTAASVYCLASRRLPVLRERAISYGVAYGAMVYAVMYHVVMPLSAFRKGPFSFTLTVIAVLTHIFCVGLPIALAARRFYR